jgi:hypothetical protein
MTTKHRTLLICTSLILGVWGSAQAATTHIVHGTTGQVTHIYDLLIVGQDYDVEFHGGSFNSVDTYNGALPVYPATSTQAVQSIGDYLNANSLGKVNVASHSHTLETAFIVPDALPGAGIVDVRQSTYAASWSSPFAAQFGVDQIGSVSVPMPTWAILTHTGPTNTVPVPGSLVLAFTGLVSLSKLRKTRKRLA